MKRMDHSISEIAIKINSCRNGIDQTHDVLEYMKRNECGECSTSRFHDWLVSSKSRVAELNDVIQQSVKLLDDAEHCKHDITKTLILEVLQDNVAKVMEFKL